MVGNQSFPNYNKSRSKNIRTIYIYMKSVKETGNWSSWYHPLYQTSKSLTLIIKAMSQQIINLLLAHIHTCNPNYSWENIMMIHNFQWVKNAKKKKYCESRWNASMLSFIDWTNFISSQYSYFDIVICNKNDYPWWEIT